MRETLILALAKFANQTLTPEVGRQIVAAACGERDDAIPIACMGFEQLDGYIIKPERVAGNELDLLPIHASYYRSTRPNAPDDMSFDYAMLREAERRGEVVMFTARTAATRQLVSVLRVRVFRDIETGKLRAADDMFYTTKYHRSLALSVRLWKFAERSMFKHGVREVTFTSLGVTGAERMARFLGYTPKGIVFTKSVAQDGCDYSDLPTRHRPGVVQHEPVV